MAENLSNNIYPFLPEATINDSNRANPLLLEYHYESFTVGTPNTTQESTKEIVTHLGEILGLIEIKFVAVADDPTDTIQLLTDCVITTGAVTVTLKALAIADGATVCKFFLVGRKTATVLLNTP